jgi:capsular polysaccharide biosynthesis protein
VNKASAVESPTRCDPAPKRVVVVVFMVVVVVFMVVVVVFMVEIVDFRILSGREGCPAGSMERMAGP